MRPGRPVPIRVISVQDGDSLTARLLRDSGEQFRVRLYAIDAPERDQPYGQEARDYLWRLVGDRSDLLIEVVDTDQYGRLVGVLHYRAMGRRRSVNRLMVERGLAWWYSRYGGHGLGLEDAERDAQRKGRGLWSDRERIAPWEHRSRHRRQAQKPGCLRLILVSAAAGIAVVAAVVLLERAA